MLQIYIATDIAIELLLTPQVLHSLICPQIHNFSGIIWEFWLENRIIGKKVRIAFKAHLQVWPFILSGIWWWAKCLFVSTTQHYRSARTKFICAWISLTHKRTPPTPSTHTHTHTHTHNGKNLMVNGIGLPLHGHISPVLKDQDPWVLHRNSEPACGIYLHPWCY